MSEHTSGTGPSGITVQVRSEYLAEQSNPAESRYVFAYHVKITNAGDHAAKLLTRHWIIMDGEARVQEVRGDGVVGQQPRLAPGESYEYTSGTVLETP
ncbi:MAG: Co2+/Mg2+ efflux protein ApaG, partial [Moraxellaceae bacterium]